MVETVLGDDSDDELESIPGVDFVGGLDAFGESEWTQWSVEEHSLGDSDEGTSRWLGMDHGNDDYDIAARVLEMYGLTPRSM
jgi:hypothetical protein